MNLRATAVVTELRELIIGIESCDSAKCRGLAVCRFEWPGSPPQFACPECGQRALNLAGVFGFRLWIERVPVHIIRLDDEDDTRARARLLEIDP